MKCEQRLIGSKCQTIQWVCFIHIAKGMGLKDKRSHMGKDNIYNVFVYRNKMNFKK